MDGLSESARQLLASLQHDASPLERIFGRSARWNLDVIEQLGRSGETAAIPHLLPAVFSSDRAGRKAAVRAVRSMLAAADIEDLPRLDEAMRRGWHDQLWRELAPGELARFVGPGEPGAVVLELASMHPNGFVREEAIRRLNLRADGTELPYLLLRLNDWAAPVRRAAHDAVSRRVKPDYADAFIAAFALVARLAELKRSDHSELLAQIVAQVFDPRWRNAALGLLQSESRTVRRACFRLLLENCPEGRPEIVSAALAAPDPTIRYRAVGLLPETLERSALHTVLVRLCCDTAAPVRRAALSALVSAAPELAVDVLDAALMDRNASVRSLARYCMKDRGAEWFRQFYENALASAGSRLATAIAGVAETGGAAAADRLAPLLAHERAGIRRAAVRYLSRLGGEGYIDAVFRCVMDASAGVSNEARLAIRRNGAAISGERIWSQYIQAHAIHVRRNLLRLLAARPKWEALNFLLLASRDDDAELRALALWNLERWTERFNTSQLTPTVTELANAKLALSQAGVRIPEWMAGFLQHSLRSFEA